MSLLRNILIMFLLLISFSYSFSDEITLHFIPSPSGLNWSNPQTLLLSTIKNGLTFTSTKKHAIGHVYVELKCDSKDVHLYAGMSSKGIGPGVNVLFKKYGMGALYVVNKGKHQKTNEILKDLKKQYKKGRSSFFTVEVSPESCERALKYYEEYDALGYGSKYSGLNMRPRYQEGSGCSAYGASYLEIAGVLPKTIENKWMQDINVPLKYIGGPITGNKVNVFKLLTAFNSRWAYENEPHLRTHFYDPDLMHRWAQSAFQKIEKGELVDGYKMFSEMRGKSVGVKIDLSDAPTPTDDFWLKRPL